MQFRQGDVFLIKVKNKPKNATKKARDKGRVVLAYGEVTGHSHAITEREVDLYEDAELGAFLVVQEAEALLQHEEHDTVPIPRGTYEVRIHREYSPEAIRNVAD